MSDIINYAKKEIVSFDYSYLTKQSIFNYLLFLFLLIIFALYFGYQRQFDRQLRALRPYFLAFLNYFEEKMRFIRIHSRSIITIWFFIVFIFIIVLLYPNTDYKIL